MISIQSILAKATVNASEQLKENAIRAFINDKNYFNHPLRVVFDPINNPQHKALLGCKARRSAPPPNCSPTTKLEACST
jgi:hypothetical protein